MCVNRQKKLKPTGRIPHDTQTVWLPCHKVIAVFWKAHRKYLCRKRTSFYVFYSSNNRMVRKSILCVPQKTARRFWMKNIIHRWFLLNETISVDCVCARLNVWAISIIIWVDFTDVVGRENRKRKSSKIKSIRWELKFWKREFFFPRNRMIEFKGVQRKISHIPHLTRFILGRRCDKEFGITWKSYRTYRTFVSWHFF